MAYADYDLIEATVEGQIGILALNQPERLNPISPANVEIQIRDALVEFENDTNIRAVIFTGKGKSFSAGADVRPNGPPPDPRLAGMEGSGSSAGRFLYGAMPGGPSVADGSMWAYLHHFRKPLIGAVRGYALGGGWELAEACDVIVAGESAKFGTIEIKLGLFPFGLGTQYLARTVGKHRAMWLMMTGELIDAQTALDWGLVNSVVPDDDMMTAAMDMAKLITQHAPLALGVLKYMTNKALKLEEHYDLERVLAYHLQTTKDTQAVGAAWRNQTGEAVVFENK
jgi:enoyl-CoA hydratase/carnithine racemase